MKKCFSLLAYLSICLCLIIGCKKNIGSKTDEKVNGKKESPRITSTSARESSTPFMDIFKAVDREKIQAAISSEDNETLNQIINTTNERIVETFREKYNIDLNEEFNGEYKYGITLMGVYYAAKERYQLDGHELEIDIDNIHSDRYSATFDCFLTAVGAAIGIADAKNIWKSIVAGASEQTVIAAVKLIARRVATVLTVAILVYQVGDCLDWW